MWASMGDVSRLTILLLTLLIVQHSIIVESRSESTEIVNRPSDPNLSASLKSVPRHSSLPEIVNRETERDSWTVARGQPSLPELLIRVSRQSSPPEIVNRGPDPVNLRFADRDSSSPEIVNRRLESNRFEIASRDPSQSDIVNRAQSPRILRIAAHQWSPSEIVNRGPDSNRFTAAFRDSSQSEIVNRAPDSSAPKIVNREASSSYLAKRIPDRWRIIPREPQLPRIELQLLKEYVGGSNPNLVARVEYRYSDNNRAMESSGNRNVANTIKDETNKVSPKKGLDGRTIIQVPSKECPAGENKDHKGNCREVVEIE